MAKRHVVGLTDDEREALGQREAGLLTRRQRYRVQILLRADAGYSGPRKLDHRLSYSDDPA